MKRNVEVYHFREKLQRYSPNTSVFQKKFQENNDKYDIAFFRNLLGTISSTY